MSELTREQKLWVEALRSGKYEQGKFNLQDQGRYCCLGVACKVYEEDTLEKANYKEDPCYPEINILAGNTLIYQEQVADWLGISSHNGALVGGGALTVKNDYDCLTFSEIADIIESNPEGLFIKFD